MGNRKLEMMREACERVSSAKGPVAAEDLSMHWHEIGLQDLKEGKGECWLA